MITKAATYLLKIVTALLCFFAILLATPWGSQLTIVGVNQLNFISLNYQSGSWLNTIVFDDIHLDVGSVNIDAKDVEISLHLRCFFNNKLCIDNIEGKTFSLSYQADKTASSTSQTSAQTRPQTQDRVIEFPFGFDINALAFNQVTIDISDVVTVTVENFASKAQLNHHTIAVASPSASKVEVISVTSSNSTAEKQTINLPSVFLPLNLKIENLAVKKLDITTSSNPNNIQELADIKLSGSWYQHDVVIKQSEVFVAPYGKIISQGDSKLLTPYTVNLQSHITLETLTNLPMFHDVSQQTRLPALNFFTALSNSQQVLTLSGQLDQLNANLVSQGDIDATVDLAINLTSRLLPFKLNLSSNHLPPLTIPTTALAEESLIIDQANLASQGDRYKQSFAADVLLSGFDYQQAQLTLAGSQKQGEVVLTHINFNDENSDSQVTLDGNLTIKEQLSWQFHLNSTGLSLPRRLRAISNNWLPALDGRIAGEFDSNGFIKLTQPSSTTSTAIHESANWLVDINNVAFSGQVNSQEFELNGQVSVDSLANINDSNLTIKAFNNKLTLKGNNRDSWQISGNWQSNNLAPFINFYQQMSPNEHATLTNSDNHNGTSSDALTINGSMESWFNISGAKHQPNINLISASKQLKITKLSTGKRNNTLITIKQPKLAWHYQPNASHQTKLALTSDTLYYQHHQFDAIEAKISGDINDQKLALNWQGDLAANIALSSQWQKDAQQLQGALTLAEFNYKDHKFTPNQSPNWHFDVKTTRLTIDKHCWLTPHIELCANNDLVLAKEGSVDLHLQLAGEWLNQQLLSSDVILDTDIEGDIVAQWQPELPPSLLANLTISPGVISYVEQKTENTQENERAKTPLILSQWQSGAINIELSKEQLLTHLSLTKTDNQVLVNINNRLTLPDHSLSGSVVINQLNLKPLQKLIPDIDDLNANISSNIAVSGKLSQPIVKGELAIKQGKISFTRSASDIENLDLIASINDHKATINGSLTVNNAPISYQANMAWQDEFNVSATLSAEKLALDFPPNVNIIVAPSLIAHYQNNLLQLNGNIDVIDGLLTLAQFPEGSVKISDDTIIVDDSGNAISQQKKFAIKSDINININERFKLEGFGFTGNLSGDLKVQQAPFQPMQVFGDMSVLNGSYQAYGQDLQVKQGKVNFNGPLKTPYVDFRAERYIKNDDVTVGLTVAGPSNAIELQLYSQPTMEQPETLSYLIRGQGLDSGTGNTAAIGIALGTTLTKAENLNKLIQKLPLLHDISVDTEVDGDQAQATISGYLGERIYLKYGVGIYEPIDEITVRLYLMNKLWLETVSGIEKSADIYYSFDVD
ncbi:translocation/assembly module TamB domain-containing protein [Thalassotalea sp. PLHSN55]|uniref:translocation/assembly module TamB domain-containing protein n=1 Tax=Thalassotalea sp. PLHSN55 TaxID=3435888 RepID=UPI003F829977